MGMAPGGTGTRGRRGRGQPPISEINVTPLVDVMLVLLIIFMVTAPLLTAAVPIDLPDSKAQPLEQTPDPLTVSIDREGRVFLDADPLAPGELPDRIVAMAEGGKMPQVTLRADRALDYGRVVAVMGELNAAGVTQIALVTTGGGAAPVTAGSAAAP